MNEKFAFLLAPRFYAGILGSIGAWLQVDNPFTPHGIGVLFISLGAVFLAVETWDKTVKKIVAGRTTQQQMTVETKDATTTATVSTGKTPDSQDFKISKLP
jgi:hypothetical protein